MSPSEPSPPDPAPVPSARPVVQELYVDSVEAHRSRRRTTGAMTLLVAGAWIYGAYRVYKYVGTLLLAGGFSTLLGGLPLGGLPLGGLPLDTPPTTSRSAATTPTTQSIGPADALAMLLDPFATPTTTAPATRSVQRRDTPAASAEAAREAAVWGEGIRHVWIVMMWIVGAGMIPVGLWALAGSDRAVPMHHALAWVIIAATLGTFVAISLLVDLAGFPPMSPVLYVLITLVCSGYGWILLYFEASLLGETGTVADR
jgi:hypothetical protein